jgi:hypothetical protein
MLGFYVRLSRSLFNVYSEFFKYFLFVYSHNLCVSPLLCYVYIHNKGVCNLGLIYLPIKGGGGRG